MRSSLIEEFCVSHGDNVHGLFFSPDGGVLVSISQHQSVFWDCDGRRILEVDNKGIPVTVDSFDESGTQIVLAGLPGRIVNLSTGNERTLRSSCRVKRVKLSPNGELIAGVDEQGGVTVWKARELTTYFEIPTRVGGPTSSEIQTCYDVSFRSDSACLLTVGRKEWSEWNIARHHGEADERSEAYPEVAVWDLVGGKKIDSIDEELLDHGEGQSRWLSADYVMEDGWYSADSSAVVTRRGDDRIIILDADPLMVRNTIDHPSFVEQLYLSPDGRRIVTVDDEGIARIWFEHFEPIHESIDGPLVDPRNGFGLPVGKRDPLPRYRILIFGTLIVVETWPERQTVVSEHCSLDVTLLTVQPGSNCQAFAVAGNEGDIAFFRLKL